MMIIGCGQKPKTEKDEDIQLEEVIAMSYDQKFDESQLLTDYKEIVSLVQNVHPTLYTDQVKLEASILKAEEAIHDQMTELEFFRAMAPIISSINCGHSWLSLSKESSDQLSLEGSFFPLSLKWIGSKAYVFKNQGAPEIPLASEIISINGKTSSEIRLEMFGYFTADGQNETHKDFMLNRVFNYYYKMVVDESAAFEVEYQSENSKVEKLTIKGLSNEELEGLYGTGWPEEEIPYKAEIKDAYAILTIKSFYMPQAFALDEYKAFLASFFKEIKEIFIFCTIIFGVKLWKCFSYGLYYL